MKSEHVYYLTMTISLKQVFFFYFIQKCFVIQELLLIL